jgi:small subunit ribosomal protein S15
MNDFTEKNIKSLEKLFYIYPQIAFLPGSCDQIRQFHWCKSRETRTKTCNETTKTKKGMAIMATITKEKAAEITAKFGANEKDTGNVRVQIALLTEKIKNLTEHAKTHKKDFHSLRGLSMMVSKRKNLLKYYGEKDIVAQRALIKELGLRG